MPYEESTIPGQKAVPAPPVTIKSHEEYKVETIVDSQLCRGRLEYLVHWKGFTVEHDSWKPETNLKNSKKYVTKFYKHRPSAPRHLSSAIFEGYTWRELRNFMDIRCQGHQNLTPPSAIGDDCTKTEAEVTCHKPGHKRTLSHHHYSLLIDPFPWR